MFVLDIFIWWNSTQIFGAVALCMTKWTFLEGNLKKEDELNNEDDSRLIFFMDEVTLKRF